MSTLARDLVGKPAFVQAISLQAGEVTARALLEAHLDAIAGGEANGGLNAFTHLAGEWALSEAETVDRKRETGKQLHPLAGVPLAVKDIINVEGLPTTCGSQILEGFIAPFDATAVSRLRKAGLVILGKTNLDEFGMGSSTEHTAFGAARNPHAPTRTPGGSSGGSAAAVAAGYTPFALGSDTGGSVRQPAALCGVVGLKPTYGRVSRYGLVAFASSLDQIGPIGREVRDVAALLEVMAGRDPRDATSADREVPRYLEVLNQGVEGLRVGLPLEYFPAELEPDVSASCRRAASVLEEAGAELLEVSLPHTPYVIPTYYIVAPAEASSNLARYDGVRYGNRARADEFQEMYQRTRDSGFGREVKRRILLGTYVLSAGYYEAFYLRGMKARTLILRDFQEAFRRVDLLLTPTTPGPAFPLGERLEDPVSMYLSDIFTASANLAGIPALSVSFGHSGGLPLGVQLMAPHFEEVRLLRTGRVLETDRDLAAE